MKNGSIIGKVEAGKVRTTTSNQANEAFDTGIRLETRAQFQKAKYTYEDILHHVTDATVLEKVRYRMEDIDALITAIQSVLKMLGK